MIVRDRLFRLRGFLNSGCVNERFWKRGFGVGYAALVSHPSHREHEKGCAMPLICVRSVSKLAWTNDLEKTSDSQEGEASHNPSVCIAGDLTTTDLRGGSAKRLERRLLY